MTETTTTAAAAPPRATMGPAAHGYADSLAGDHDDPARWNFTRPAIVAEYRDGYQRGRNRLAADHPHSLRGYPPPTPGDVAGWHSRYRDHRAAADVLADLADEYAAADGGELVAAELRRAAGNQAWSANYWAAISSGQEPWDIWNFGNAPC